MDNNRRKDTSHTQEFDWDAYDRSTSPAGNRAAYSRRRRIEEERNSQRTSRRTPSSAPDRHEPKRQPPKKTNKKRKRKLSEEQIKKRRRIRAIFILLLIVIFIAVTGMCIGIYAAASREIKEMNISGLALNYASFIYYEDPNGVTREYEKIQSESTRIWIESDQIPDMIKDAVVSIEDERFYKHGGVDIKRTMGATIKWALAKVGIGQADYGGSTITQQVIKNITSEKENKASRKIKEMFRAIALEQELTKDEILTMYLNIVYFANNCYGIEAASNTYFNKSANALTLAEAASIVGITQYPSLYDPVANPDNNVEKRNIVLSKMYELGKISDAQYAEAVSSPLILSDKYKSRKVNISSYFTDQVVADVIRDLQNEKGYSYEFATQQVYNGGLKIFCTVDSEIQESMESIFADKSNLNLGVASEENTLYTNAQAGMVLMDPYTGAVKALVGGLGEKTDIRGWNRATQAKRQPGSSIKPLSAYAPAIDRGKINETEVIVDEEITLGSDKWKPKNSYTGYKGEMTAKEAVAISANTVAAKVVDQIGLTSSYSYLSNMFHIPLTEKDKNYAALSLGGLSEGVSPQDMAGAYCTFVNGGRYIEPYTYTQVQDATGNVILNNLPNGVPESTQAISAATAYIVSDMLRAVVSGEIPGATGTAANLSTGIPVYGKTGTTDDNFDKWFVGYTPYYVGAVWFGYDQPDVLNVKGNPALYAWKTVMEKVHQNLDPNVQIAKPDNIVEVRTCMISGKLPKSSCYSTNSYFVKGTEPKVYCSSHYRNASSRYDSGASQTSSPTTTASPTASASASPSPSPGATSTTQSPSVTPANSQSPASQAPTPQTPSPQTPTPQTPTPQTPTPQTPAPQLPTQAPAEQAPVQNTTPQGSEEVPVGDM